MTQSCNSCLQHLNFLREQSKKDLKSMVSKISKSDLAAQNKFLKPQWKCPDCRTINQMDYNCSKCRKDCFSFYPPPSLANPGEKEEVKDEVNLNQGASSKHIKSPIAEGKPESEPFVPQ